MPIVHPFAGKSLVIGIGNPILTDDGIGPRLVERCRDEAPIPGVEYRTESVGGLEILEQVQGYENVVFIDAIKTQDGVPGTVSRFSLDDFKETAHLSNPHDVSFLTALKLGKLVGFSIPRRVAIIAVEIEEDMVFSDRMTPALEENYPRIFGEVTQLLLEELGAGDTRSPAS